MDFEIIDGIAPDRGRDRPQQDQRQHLQLDRHRPDPAQHGHATGSGCAGVRHRGLRRADGPGRGRQGLLRRRSSPTPAPPRRHAAHDDAVQRITDGNIIRGRTADQLIARAGSRRGLTATGPAGAPPRNDAGQEHRTSGRNPQGDDHRRGTGRAIRRLVSGDRGASPLLIGRRRRRLRPGEGTPTPGRQARRGPFRRHEPLGPEIHQRQRLDLGPDPDLRRRCCRTRPTGTELRPCARRELRGQRRRQRLHLQAPTTAPLLRRHARSPPTT